MHGVHEISALFDPQLEPVTRVPLWSRSPNDAASLVLGAIVDLDGHHHPVSLQKLGDHLVDRHPEFDCRIYSRRTLTDLLRALPSVKLTEKDGLRLASLVDDETGTG